MDLIEKYDPSIDLIFLDIQMRLLDGLHTAERLRQMIDALEELPFDRCITGHGSPEDKTSLLRELRKEAGLAAGKA